MIKGNEPAYPTYESERIGEYTTEGLTIRQYFAAMALASGSTPKDAILKADALIDELNKPQP